MAYENVDKLLATVQSFVADIKEAEEAKDQRELASIERRAVNKLQLAEVEIEAAGRDLYSVVQRRRGELRRGL